ncbi:MAG TPA: hypothetical protein DCZ13_01030 [Porticoccaceae bacterium]|nr:hypothetical protein [Porticoccaceae bacterium]
MGHLNNHVVDLLATELRYSLENVQDAITQLEVSQLPVFRDSIKEINGVCAMAGVASLELLTREAVAATDAALGEQIPLAKLSPALAKAFGIAPRLLEYLIDTRQDNPCVLLPVIASLRALRQLPPVYEHHLIPDVTWPRLNQQGFTDALVSNRQHDLKRLVNLYQFGLLDLVRDSNRGKAWRILHRVAQRMQSHAPTPLEQNYWRAVEMTLTGFQAGRLRLRLDRIRLLAAVEKQLRILTIDDERRPRNPYPEGLWRSFICLLGLISPNDEKAKALYADLQIPTLPFTEQDVIAIQRRILSEPQENTAQIFSEIATVLAETRKIIDDAHRDDASAQDEDFRDQLHTAFDRLSQLWDLLGFSGLARRFRQPASRLLSNRGNGRLPPEMLVEFIDTILQAECALIDFDDKTPSRKDAEAWERRPLNEILQANFLQSAKLAVVGEIRAHLAEIKEMIDTVVAGHAGKDLLPAFEATFDIISGSLRLIDMQRPAELAERCLSFIRGMLTNPADPPSMDNYWEVFADSIACLEYYLDTSAFGNAANESSLDTANECLQALGV